MVLAGLGDDTQQIDKLVATFVAHDNELLDKAQAVFRDEDKLIALSKTSRAELANILREDAEADGRSDNLAPEQQAEKEIRGATQAT